MLSALADAGCNKICLVVAPDHTAIRDYYDGPGRPSRVQVTYAAQPIANGTARAVESAEVFTGTDPFLVLNSDNLYPAAVLRALVDLDGPGLPAYERDTLIGDSGSAGCVRRFAAIEVARRRLPHAHVENTARNTPAAGPTRLISMEVWRFRSQLFSAARVPKSARGIEAGGGRPGGTRGARFGRFAKRRVLDCRAGDIAWSATAGDNGGAAVNSIARISKLSGMSPADAAEPRRRFSTRTKSQTFRRRRSGGDNADASRCRQAQIAGGQS